MSSISLRARVVLITALALAPILFGAHLALNQLFVRHVTAQAESSLRVTLEQLAAGIVIDPLGRSLSLKEPQGDPRWSKVYSGAYWQVNAPEGLVASGVLRSRSLWDFVLTLPGDPLAPGAIHIHRLPGPAGQSLLASERSVTIEDSGKTFPVRLIAAIDLRELNQAIDDFASRVAQYLIVFAVVLIVLLMIQVSIGLSPLNRLNHALDRLRRSETEQLEGAFPSEIRPLVDNLNGVLGQHRRHVERARSISGNLAHALKTPLSVLANAGADARSTPDELRALIRSQTTLAQKQVEWHLKRARMAAATSGSGHRCPVGRLAEGIVSVMKRVHADRDLQIRVDAVAPDALFFGEQQDLQEILGNLVDNACKWAAAQVVISAQSSERGLVLRVEDDGPGVAPDHYAEILQRGVRIDELTPGTGLGLSIVSELVSLYEGTLRFSSSPLGGLAVEVEFPMGSMVSESPQRSLKG